MRQMGKQVRLALLIGTVLVLVIVAVVAVAAVSHSAISYRAGEYQGAPTGEVLVNGEVVFSIRTSAGGWTPEQRAQVVAERLQALPESAYTAKNVSVRKVGDGNGIYVGSTRIVSVSPDEAKAHNTTYANLASVWSDNLSRAFAGEVVGPDPEVPGGYVDWNSTSQKWVPIFSLDQNGIQVGAAQVAGPAVQVDQVKGVARLALDFRNFARIYTYIPVSTISVTKLDRVQGVSVWATGDVKILGF